MIRYALRCDNGHGFESWFRGSDAFDSQVKRGLVACPHCDSVRIEKQIMAPAVALREAATSGGPHQQEPASLPVAMPDVGDRALRDMIREFRHLVEANTENVGPAFAEEARKIHYGEVEHRAIRGEASPDEVKALREEGVEVAPLPILPDDRN